MALPEGVDKKFAELSELLLEFAQGRVKGARELVADAVLGTCKESGGRSAFQEYALIKRDAAIVARVRELLMQDAEDLQKHTKARKNASRNSRAKPRSAGTRAKPPPSLPTIKSQSDALPSK